MIQRIPISLLELNTVGHAICAVLVYILWWEKPFEVDYPTMIQGQVLWDIRSLIWMRYNRSSAAESFKRDLRNWLESDQWFQTLSEVESFNIASLGSILALLSPPNTESAIDDLTSSSLTCIVLCIDSSHGCKSNCQKKILNGHLGLDHRC